MRLVVVISAVFVCGIPCLAQPSEDSLLVELENAKHDTTRVIILNNLTGSVINQDPDQALIYSEKAIKLALEIGFDRELTSAYNNNGIAHYYKGNLDKASRRFQQKLALSKKINDKAGVASALNFLGILATVHGKFDEGLKYHSKSLKIRQESGDVEGIASSYNNIASIYARKGDYDKGIEYNIRALELFEKHDLKEGVASSYGALVTLYIYIEDFIKAKEIAVKALELFEALNMKNQQGSLLLNLGIAYLNLDEVQKATEAFEKALVISEPLGNKLNLAHIYFNSAQAFWKSGDIKTANGNIKKAKQLFKELDEPGGLANCLEREGEYFLNSGDYDKAIGKFQQALSIGRSIDSKDVRKSSLKKLAEAYDKKGDHLNAYNFQSQFIAISDSMFNEEKSRQIAEIQTKYDTEKKERENVELVHENALHRAENEIQSLQLSRNYYLIIGLSGLAFLILIISTLIIRQNKLQAKQHATQLEAKLLRSQMNPHFIFNSLIAIQSFIFSHDKKEAGKYLSDFASLMRLILENSREDFISLDREIETLTHYMELQRLRFDNKFSYSINIAPDIDSENMTIPPMFAQPFIENSLEHGQILDKKEGKIKVDFSLQNGSLLMEVSDNGIGRTQAAKPDNLKGRDHQSLATVITMERIQNLRKKIKRKISFDITDIIGNDNQVNGTKVTFQIPVKII